MSIACRGRRTSRPSTPSMTAISRKTRRRASSCSFTRGRGRSTSRSIAWRPCNFGHLLRCHILSHTASTRCPLWVCRLVKTLWVIREIFAMSALRPLCPRERTLVDGTGTAAAASHMLESNRNLSPPSTWHNEILRNGAFAMPLQQGEVQGYDFNRSVVEFTMLNQGKVILCAISTAAMDDLEGRRDVRPDQRVDQFMRLREVIEERASRKFFEEQAQADRPVVLRSNDFFEVIVTFPHRELLRVLLSPPPPAPTMWRCRYPARYARAPARVGHRRCRPLRNGGSARRADGAVAAADFGPRHCCRVPAGESGGMVVTLGCSPCVAPIARYGRIRHSPVAPLIPAPRLLLTISLRVSQPVGYRWAGAFDGI